LYDAWCAPLTAHVPAGVPYDMLTEVGQKISSIPDGFTPHRQIKKVFDKRANMLSSPESAVDWGMAEALAFGTLVAEGNHVRVSGQVRSISCTG
jgi:2-oxoglutarate dehydrogenase E1 component